ncbi:SSS family solute:Na+ symporter [Saccharomonospora amisosensis]|uniref:SSS family solute:Na+ symporter n=1 Tax=Saccharomonospora amisosensis TaxID=1128677 RepID=A0A7X5UPU2_9PSEU|nr:sodium:solute symporter family protein [Saccharomonospora amisosensis]NIJ11518.1 SSS family solute:Na+ symporter [Saccharomonospora amisosensis]
MIIIGVGLSVLAIVVIGLAVARKVDGDATNFLVAGRSLALPLSAAGLMGQAVDTNATLGNTDLSAAAGFWAGASLPIGLAGCLVLTGLFFAKRMNRMKLLTIADFYRRRYGRGVEIVASVLMIFSFCILLAGNLVAGGYLFEQFLGTSYTVGVLLIVLVVVGYTAAGGMFSDAYTAFAQMIITVCATLALFAWVAARYGITIPEGMGPFDLGQLGDTEQGAPMNWATLFALGVGDIVAIDFMQRIFAARSPKVAQRACFVGALGTLAVGVPFSLVALSSGEILGPEGAEGPVLFAVLERAAPPALTILVLSGIVAASCSTANGAILGTSAVAARNVFGVRIGETPSGSDQLLRATRFMLLPVVGVAVLFALRVPETGILLTLAFDVMLAALAVPFVLGHYWRRSCTAAAVAAIAVGSTVRLVLFVLTPTMYGAPNTLWYVPNDLVGAGLDGWVTFLAAAASLVAFVVVALARRPQPVPDVFTEGQQRPRRVASPAS